MPNAVELRQVTKRFGSHVAVDQLNLDVPEGTVYGFIGPNGSGKTTTLRMILRIFYPDAGQITVLGLDHGSGADDRVGYLPGGARLVQEDEGAGHPDLLCAAQGYARLPPRYRRLASATRPRQVGESQSGNAVEGHVAEGTVHCHHRCAAQTGRAGRTLQRPGPGEHGGAQGRGRVLARPRVDRDLLDARHGCRRTHVRHDLHDLPWPESARRQSGIDSSSVRQRHDPSAHPCRQRRPGQPGGCRARERLRTVQGTADGSRSRSAADPPTIAGARLTGTF